MNKNSTKYTFIFALIVCVVCSFALALVSEGLRPKRELNEAYDVKKNILAALDQHAYEEFGVIEAYERMVEEIVIDVEGSVVEGRTPKDIVDGEINDDVS